MRVKVGDTWYSPEVGQPIMVELTDKDKTNIANMHEQATRYAEFNDNDPDLAGPENRQKRIAWMEPEELRLEFRGANDPIYDRVLHIFETVPGAGIVYTKGNHGKAHTKYVAAKDVASLPAQPPQYRWDAVYVHGCGLSEADLAHDYPYVYSYIFQAQNMTLNASVFILAMRQE